jgi:hypothetical protein
LFSWLIAASYALPLTLLRSNLSFAWGLHNNFFFLRAEVDRAIDSIVGRSIQSVGDREPATPLADQNRQKDSARHRGPPIITHV